MESNTYWTTDHSHTTSSNIEQKLHPVLLVFISLDGPCTKNKICVLNTNKVRAILQPQVLKFQHAVFRELGCCFSLFRLGFQ